MVIHINISVLLQLHTYFIHDLIITGSSSGIIRPHNDFCINHLFTLHDNNVRRKTRGCEFTQVLMIYSFCRSLLLIIQDKFLAIHVSLVMPISLLLDFFINKYSINTIIIFQSTNITVPHCLYPCTPTTRTVASG
jgi:hypothetical protein